MYCQNNLHLSISADHTFFPHESRHDIYTWICLGLCVLYLIVTFIVKRYIYRGELMTKLLHKIYWLFLNTMVVSKHIHELFNDLGTSCIETTLELTEQYRWPSPRMTMDTCWQVLLAKVWFPLCQLYLCLRQTLEETHNLIIRVGACAHCLQKIREVGQAIMFTTL